MKIKKFLALAVLSVMLFTCQAYSAQPEDALSSYYDDSVYFVLRLEDTSRLLKWIFSSDNLKLFMPLAMKGKPELQAIAASEFINAMVSMTPLRSAAMIVGVSKRDIMLHTPFLQMAFKVKPEFNYIVEKIAEGKAEPIDIAMLMLGSRIAAAFAETTIKVEHEDDNILRVNNNIFMTAVDDMVIIASSINNIRTSKRALANPDARLFTKIQRRFSEKDFAFLHIDYETAAELDGTNKDKLDPREFFDKPLEFEFAFKRIPDRFIMSAAVNLSTSLKKEFADEMLKHFANFTLAKGGNIDLASAGGRNNPIAAIGTNISFEKLRENDALKQGISDVLRNLRVRFGISEQDAMNFFNGPSSLVVNGTVTFEGFKLPALYFSQNGQPKAANKIFSTLNKSPHFSKIQDGILQLDSSLSPISCLVADNGDKLGMYFAELASLSDKPSIKPALNDLLKRDSVASLWIDFAELQRWLNDDENGVLMAVGPLMTFAGYGEYFKILREILAADLSITSVSVWSDAIESSHIEFALKDINVEDGLLSKLIKLSQELKNLAR